MPGNLNAGVGSDPPFAVLALNLGRGVLDVLCGRRFVLTVTGLFDAVCLPPPFFSRKRIGSRLKKDIPSRDVFRLGRFALRLDA